MNCARCSRPICAAAPVTRTSSLRYARRSRNCAEEPHEHRAAGIRGASSRPLGAADLVTIEAEELSPVLDAAAPPSGFAPGLTTEALVLRESYGEVDAAFASAHVIVGLDLEIGRHSGVPLETRGALARYDTSRDVLELYGAAKVPHRNRDSLARMFGRSAASVVLKEGNTGGGFGIRGELYPG